jgi:hypothetical protein
MAMATETKDLDLVLKIEWSGPSNREAEELASALAEAGSVSVSQAHTARATMAAGEIVLTILASAATQAIIHVAIDKLRDYVKHKISAGRVERKKAPDMTIIVKGKDANAVEKLISLRLATVDFAARFMNDLGEEIAKAIG